MASTGLRVPRLDLGAGRAAEQQGASDASRASSGSARTRLLAITERVLAKSNAENVTPRLSSRVLPSVSRLSVRSKTPNPDDPPPTSRREGNSSRRNAGTDSTTPTGGMVMQRATFLDALITARRASGSAIPTPRNNTAGAASATPLPPRLAVAHLTTPGSLTARGFRSGTPKAGGLPTSRIAGSNTTARTPPSAGTPTGSVPASISVTSLADLASKRRAAAAKALDLQAARAAARSAAAARRADLADMEVANNALAAELASLKGQVEEESNNVQSARDALLETMKAAAQLLELKDVESALDEALKVKEPETPSDLASPLAQLSLKKDQLPAVAITERPGPNTGRSLSPGAVERLNKLGSKLSEAETLLEAATEVNRE